MNKIIKINDICIDFTYQFDDYFSDTLNKYEINSPIEGYSTMRVSLKDDIKLNLEDYKSVKIKNQIIYESNQDKYIITYINDSSEIKHIIYYQLNYKNIVITLNNKIGKRLAEYEYVLTGMMFLEMALYNNYLPVHASAFTVNDYTILLSAPSGVGKSTQTNYFKEVYDNIILINEDKPLLKIINGECYVIGSPWSGKDVINSNIIKKVDGIFFLNQADKLEIINLDSSQKVRLIFKNIQRPIYQELIGPLSKQIDDLIKKVNIYQFDCVNNISSSKFLYNYMEEINENKT